MAVQAQRLLRAAASIRRVSGRLTYHPVSGRRPQHSPELLSALAGVERVIKEIQQTADERSREEVALSAAGAAPVEQIRLSHAAIDQGVQVITTTLEVLRATLADAGSATLDAPYGRGAPARHHPGALCTMIAERVERLATALEVAAILKANLNRTAGSAAARPDV